MRKRSTGAAFVLALVCAACAQAGALQSEEVPAEAKWLVHIDVDAMRASAVMRTFYDECLAGGAPARFLDGLAQASGTDPRHELHAVTLYGTKMAPGHGVLILRAEMDKAALLQMAKKAPDYRTMHYRDYELHSLTHARGRASRQIVGAFPKAGVLVLASSSELLKSALDASDGRSANLQGKDSPLAKSVPQGTIFLVRASGIQQSQAGEIHPLCRQLERLDYAKGQHRGQWFGHLTVSAADEEAAARVEAGLTGLKAIFELSLSSAPKLQEMLDRVQTGRKGKVVQCDFEAPVEKVVEAVPAICEMIRNCCRTRATLPVAKRGDQPSEGQKAGSEGKAGKKRGDEKTTEDKRSQEKADKEKKPAEKKKQPEKEKPITAKNAEPETAPDDTDAQSERSETKTESDTPGTPILGVVVRKPPGTESAVVVRVWADTPAAKAGLRPGDRIVQVDGQKIQSAEELHKAIVQHKPGDTIQLVADRGGKRIEMKTRLAGADDFTGRRRARRSPRLLSPRPWLGIRIASGEGRGVTVAGVLPGGPADRAGLKAGDAIVRVDKTRVEAPADLQVAIAGFKPGESVRLKLNREGARKDIEVELGAFGIWEGETDEQARKLLKQFLEGRFPSLEEKPVEP